MIVMFSLLLYLQLLASLGAGALLLRGPPAEEQGPTSLQGNDNAIGRSLPPVQLAGESDNTTNLPPFSVCAMGDSITDGLQGHDDVYVNKGGFRPTLANLLKNVGGELTGYRTCPCTAFPNARSEQLHVQLAKERFLCGSPSGSRPPDIALLLIGTNDIVQQVTVDQALNNVRHLLQDMWLTSPSTIVLIASIPVQKGSQNSVHIQFDSYNKGLREMVRELKPVAPIEYVPMAEDTGVCGPQTCHTDLIHPTAEGYSVMAQEWWKFIQPRIPQLQQMAKARLQKKEKTH